MKTKTQFTNRILSLVLTVVMVLGMLPISSPTTYAAENTSTAPTINLYVNGLRVTDSQGSTDGLTTSEPTVGWSYDPSTSTLTLTNAVITKGGGSYGAAIYWTGGDLAIELVGVNTVDVDVDFDFPIFYKADTNDRALTIKGPGQLNVNGGIYHEYSTGEGKIAIVDGAVIKTTEISGLGDVIISDSTVIADGSGWAGIYSEADITITNSYVVAKSDDGSGIQYRGTLTITGSQVEAIGSRSDLAGDKRDFTNSIVTTSTETVVYGTATLKEELTIASGETINFETGASLTNADKLTVDPGAIIKANGTEHIHNADGETTYSYIDDSKHTKRVYCQDCPMGYAAETSEGHSGGQASCVSLAVCESCGASYGEVGGHTPAENATYTDNGDGTHSFTCTVCQTAVTEAHTLTDGACTACDYVCPHSNFDSATGNCKDCEISLAIAKIKTGETTTYYLTADELRTAIVNNYADQAITLLADLEIKDTIDIRNSVGTKNTLDLNGHTLICSDPIMGRILLEYGELEITGTGSINIFMSANDEGTKIVIGSGVTLNNSLRSAYGGVLDLTNATIPEAGLNVILYSDYWDTATYNVSDVLLLPADYYFFVDGKAVYTYTGETEGTVLKHAEHNYTYTDNGDGTHDATCTACGAVVDNEAHSGGTATCTEQAECQHCGASYGELAAHTPDTNGKCTVENCGYQYAAKVGDTFYETIHKALRAAEGINGCTLTLLDDVTLTSMSSYASYVNTGTFTLDLNGKTLSSNKRTLEVMGSADLTIRDSIGGGKIVSTDSSAVYLSGGKLTIESGTFEGTLDGVFLSGTSTLTVKGGTFTGSRAMITGFGSNVEIDLTAIDPAGFTLKNNGSGTFAPKLPEGYGMVGSDGKLLTSLSAEQSATVHKHEYKYTDLGGGNHQQACSCGLTTGEPAAHSTTAEDDKGATCAASAYCSVCESYYGEVDKNNHDETVAYENGFCPYCDAFEPAELVDGVYEISNAGQLYWFAQQVNGGNTAIDGKLTTNIVDNTGDVAGCNGTKAEGWRDWTPIGTSNDRYTGTFDGGSFTVSGLYFNNSGTSNVGLFGYIGGDGAVHDLGVVNSYISGGSDVGGVVGYALATVSVTNCYNSATVIGVNYVGGVVGYSAGPIANCHNSGTVCGTGGIGAAGGVVGRCYRTVTNCHNTGSVTGTGSLGGVVGANSGTVTNCYNTGNVSGSGNGVGGVAGTNTGTVTNCYNTGNVTGSKYTVGGMVGANSGGTVTNCYNTGSVTGSKYYVGGVVGQNGNAGTVTNCYYLTGCAKDGNDAVQFGIGSGTQGNTTADAEGGTTGKSDFSTGEVCYLLNGDQTSVAFKQTCGTGIPVFTGETVYYGYRSCGDTEAVYTNNANVFPEKPEHTQNPTYTDNHDGTHSAFYSCCGTTVTEAHTYVDRQCDCGAEDTSAYITGVALTVDGVTYTGAEGEGTVYITPTSQITVTIYGANLQNAPKNDHPAVSGFIVWFAAGNGTINEAGTESTIVSSPSEWTDERNIELFLVNVNSSTGDLVFDDDTGIIVTYVTGAGTDLTEIYFNNANAWETITATFYTAEDIYGDSHQLGTAELSLVGGESVIYSTTNIPKNAAYVTFSNGTETTGIIEIPMAADGTNCYKAGVWEHYHHGEVSYALTDDGKQHIATYDCCGATVTEEHNFENDAHKCVCGVVETFSVSWILSASLMQSTSTYGQEFTQTFTVPENTHLEIYGVHLEDDSTVPVNYTYENGVLTIAAADLPAADVYIDCYHYVEVTFHANGGELIPEDGFPQEGSNDIFPEDGSYWTQEWNYGLEICLGNCAEVRREGYTFVDWRDASGQVHQVIPGYGNYTLATEDITLYAQWQCNHTIGGVVFRDNGNGTHNGYCGECDELLGNYVERPHDFGDNTHKCICGKKITPEVTAPKAKENLVYDGTSQELINPGSTTGGTLQYSLDNVTWSAEIPTAITVGTHTVYYKVVGDENYEDVEAQSIIVTITDKTAPTGTILIKENSWNKFWNTITFSIFCKDYVDVTITADGTGSGVAKVEYLLSGTALEENNIPNDGWATPNADNGKYSFSIKPQNKVAVYVRITDEGGNVTVINSDGIVVYEDSVQVTESVSTTYNAGTDKDVTVKLNGNTVNAIKNGNSVLTADTDYTASADGTITLKASYLDALNAGEYTFTVSYNPQGVETDKVNMTTTFTLIIDKADGKVSNINISNKTYDGTAVTAPTFDKLGDGAATIEYKVRGADDSTYTTTTPKDAGNYVVRVTVAEGTNHKETSATTYFAIASAELRDVSVQQVGTLTYTGEALTPAVSANAVAVNNQPITFTYSTELEGPYRTEIPSFTNVGWTHRVYYRATAENHNASYGSFLVEIEKATVTEPTIASKSYSGSEQTADVTDTDLYTVVKNEGGTGVKQNGTYDVVLELKDPANYKWSTTDNAQVTLQFAITQGTNEWTVDPSITGWTYGEAAKAPVGEAKFGEVSVEYSGTTNGGAAYNSTTAPTEAGNYKATFIVQGTEDYKGLETSVDFTIAKKAVTVTANDASKIYGDSDPALTYTHTEVVGQDALDITVSRASGENANTYTITASQAEGANPNYEITFKNGTFTIHKAPLTITAEDKTATYGDAVPTYTVKYEGFMNGDDRDDLGGALAFYQTYNRFDDVGEYEIMPHGLTSDNYVIAYNFGKLTVNAKPITVTIQNVTSVYGDTLAELQATDNGIVNGDANVYSLATTATGTSNVGKYAITGTALDDNYAITFVNGEYEITKREITITVDAKNTVVNTTLPTYTYKVEGLVGVDALVTEPTLTCNANIALIGEYDITATGADAGGNYSIKYVPAKLTVLTDNAVDAAAGYTEELKDYDPATVTSEDKAELDEMLSEINTILADETTTDNGKKALEEVKEQVEKLIKEITDAAEATDTENTVKVENVTPENVTPENKTDLENAKADLEKALEDNGGNYTEDEKKAIEEEIKRIDDALEVIGNVEAVEESISKLPAVDTVKPDDEEAIKAITDAQTAYDALSDYEKSLVDEAAKANLDKLVAALVAYDIVEGDGSSWTEGSDHSITFVVNGLFSKFVGIKIDGKDVDKANYEAKAGSTIITLKASYLDTLAVGEHTITVVYTDGSTDGTFNVHAKANSPSTGDDFNIALYGSLMVVSVTALVVLLLASKKRKQAK